MSEAAPVSVVIPCWRCAGTIERALASVAAQTVAPLEILLVDDASGDGTLEALHALAKRHPTGWIRVIGLAENGGPGPARNAGWNAARGEFIAFLDADDAWHPRKLERQLEWMRAHPESVLSGHRTFVQREGDPLPAADGPLTARRVTLPAMLVSNRFHTRSVMLRRALGLRFEGRSLTEDYLLWLEIVASRAPCYALDAPLAFAFRPEFSTGGYSADLWQHERRELAALALLRERKILSPAAWLVASLWSLLKFVRRCWLARYRRAPGQD